VWPRPTEVFGEQGRVRGHWHDQGGVDYPGRPTSKTQKLTVTWIHLDQQPLTPQSAIARSVCAIIVTVAMPVVNAKARAKTVFMTRAPLNYALTCRRWVKASVTAVTFWGFSYCRPGRREAAGSHKTRLIS
jgi:hypothetical protein